MEEFELAMRDLLRASREENRVLRGRLDEAMEASSEARDHAEQGVRLGTEIRDSLERTLLPMIEEMLRAGLDRLARLRSSPVPLPKSDPAPAPAGRWVRLRRFLGRG